MQRGQVKRGFKAFRNSVKNDRNALRRMRNCKTCKYFYPEDESPEEVCHNNSVTKFDMVYDENVTYCTYWTPNWVKDE
jgi:rubredoxin